MTGEPSTFPPTSHDTDHDDRFSQLAHTHAGVYAPVEHDTTHDDRFSLLAHTHAAHADSDHDDRFALIAQGVPAGGTLGQVLAKASGTNYDTLWQSASAPAPQALDWLTDVNTAGQASTNVLTYNGTAWVPAAIPAHADADHDDRFSLLAHTHAGPLGVLGYAQVTANQTGISAITDLTGLSVAVTVGFEPPYQSDGERQRESGDVYRHHPGDHPGGFHVAQRLDLGQSGARYPRRPSSSRRSHPHPIGGSSHLQAVPPNVGGHHESCRRFGPARFHPRRRHRSGMTDETPTPEQQETPEVLTVAPQLVELWY